MPADLQTAWEGVRRQLRGEVSDFAFHVWLEPLRPLARRGGTLFVEAPEHTRTWVRERYAAAIASAAGDVLGEPAAVEIVDEGWLPPDGELARDEIAVAPARPGDPLNPRHTFEQFVICDANRFAHAAALAVAELPAQAYNPLFIHGEPGLGKTHLLHAIGNYVGRYGDGLSVCYATAETFTGEFLEALRSAGQGRDGIEAFKRRFRGADVLLIDDIQFLAAKARTCEELFHTFNALYESGRQLVFASDRPPAELADLELRLRERFACGLVVAIEPPDLDARIAILRMRVVRDGITGMGEDSLAEIARRIAGSVRALEAALIRVVAHASLRGEQASGGSVSALLSQAPAAPADATPTLADVQKATAAYFGLPPERLTARDRRPSAARARQVAMYLARELTGESLPVIGNAFRRNHATVLHACRAIARDMGSDSALREAVDKLAAGLRQPV